MIPDSLPKDSFLICNTQSSKRPGLHWMMIAKKEQGLYFVDSLGKDPKHYHKIAFVPFKEFKISQSRRTTERRTMRIILYLFCLLFIF